MTEAIIKDLKEASEKLDKEIISAHGGVRSRDLERAEKARMLVQEAITVILTMRR